MNSANRSFRVIFLHTFFLSILVSGSECLAGSAHIYWNDKNINWQGYSEGLANAKRNRKPAIIIFYADWCPTCKKFGEVFKDRKIIRAASDFIMIRVNIDKNSELSASYGFDGEYVPRTFAVSPSGNVMHKIYSPKKYQYYIGLDPNSLLALMQKARSRI